MVGSIVSLVCSSGYAIALFAHRFLMVPPALKNPERIQLWGRFTFLTVQSNLICYLFHSARFIAPTHPWITRLHPLTFALGVSLTSLYYGLDHFQPEKHELDKKWIKRGYKFIPLANHLEHGHALPLALLDAICLPRAVPETSDVIFFPVAYFTFYFFFVALAGKHLKGQWVYPIFDELEAGIGPIGPYLLGGVVCAVYVGLAFLDQAFAGGV